MDEGISIKSKGQWKDDETKLLQFCVFKYATDKEKVIEDFDEKDWMNIAELIPNRDFRKCVKRWNFTQYQGDNRARWT